MASKEEALAHKERWDSILRQAAEDEDYRQRLLREPMETLREAGVELDEVDEVLIFEFDPRRPILILPPMGVEFVPGPQAPPPEVPNG
jgi:hypothetical protein